MKSIAQSCASLLIAGALSALVASGPTLGQDGAQTITMQSDHGPGGGTAAPTIAFFGSMDFGDLRQPEFLLRDLPLFVEKLALSEEQKLAVQRTIEAYLQAFEKLAMEHLPKPPK